MQLVSAGGAGAARLVAKLIEMAFGGAQITVMVDGDEEGTRAAAAVHELGNSSIRVRQLRRQSIESYLAPRAANVWAKVLAVGTPAVWPSDLGQVDLPTLRRVRHSLPGGRSYDKVVDGRFVAGQMLAEEIDTEIVSILAEVLVDE